MSPPAPPPDQNAADKSAFFARFSGRVQGVGFRYTCLNEGRRLGVQGFVRNTSEGGLEVWAEGSPAKLEALLAWLRRGPPRARVDAVHTDKVPPTGQYREFSILG
jgi:acylphosphatase